MQKLLSLADTAVTTAQPTLKLNRSSGGGENAEPRKMHDQNASGALNARGVAK